jgi:hypothetical protein
MKRIILPTLVVLASGAWMMAQDDAAIQKALSAAPARLAKDATVIKWKADFTYDTLKKGTNDLVCYDRSGFPGQERNPFSVECTSLGNLPREAQNLKFEAMGAGKQAAMDAAEKDGTRVKPVYGSVWYHLMGPDKEHANPHMTIAVPGATTKTTGLPENGRGGGVWIMNAGTTTAHLMTPGE